MSKTKNELEELAMLRAKPEQERIEYLLKKVAIASLGAPLPPIHQVLYEP